MATVADSGIRLALIREVARVPAHWRRLMRHAVIVSFLLASLLAVSTLLGIVWMEGFSEVLQLRGWLLLFALLWVEMRILTGVLAGRGLFVRVGLCTAGERLGGALVVGGMVFVWKSSLIMIAAALTLWELVVVMVLLGWLLKQTWPSESVATSPWAFFRLALPFGVAGVGGGILGKLDLVVLGFQQSPGSIGHYAAGQTLALLALFAVIALSSAMFPSLAGMARDGRYDEARRILMPAMGTSVLFMLTLASVLVAGAPLWLSWIYGAEFASGASWLMLFAVTAVFPTLGSLFGAVVSAWGWQGRWARTVFMMLVVALPAFWLAGRQFGMPGIAACAVLAQLTPVLVIWRWLQREGLIGDRLWMAKLLTVQLIVGLAVAMLGIGHPLLWLLPVAVPLLMVMTGVCRWAWIRRVIGLLASGRRTA